MSDSSVHVGLPAILARQEVAQLDGVAADVRRGMSTRSEPSLCLPWNSAALSVPSLFLRSRTTGLMIHGTAADAMTAGKRRFVSTFERHLKVQVSTQGVCWPRTAWTFEDSPAV